MSLSDDLAEQLLTAVIDGQYPPDSALPARGELSERGGVSRLTERAAVKQSRAQSVIRVLRGRGTYVNQPDRWTALELVMRSASRTTSGALSQRLIEARRLIENGACELAASRRTEEHLRTHVIKPHHG